jgi:hypothetical protein
MRMIELGLLSAVASGTSFPTMGLGFLPGENAKVEIFSPTGDFAGSAQVQTSVDNVTWNNVGTAHTNAGYNTFMIGLQNYVRLNATARTAGSVKAVVVQDIS